jgi:FAD linked oxidases, C-terminal domain
MLLIFGVLWGWPAGTSFLIEDVACPVDRLGEMTMDLIQMFQKYGYDDASCFGHALEGNLHLVFSQGFRTAEEVQRFSDMMEEMCYIVATKHGGSLKVREACGAVWLLCSLRGWHPFSASLRCGIPAFWEAGVVCRRVAPGAAICLSCPTCPAFWSQLSRLSARPFLLLSGMCLPWSGCRRLWNAWPVGVAPKPECGALFRRATRDAGARDSCCCFEAVIVIYEACADESWTQINWSKRHSFTIEDRE